LGGKLWMVFKNFRFQWKFIKVLSLDMPFVKIYSENIFQKKREKKEEDLCVCDGLFNYINYVKYYIIIFYTTCIFYSSKNYNYILFLSILLKRIKYFLRIHDIVRVDHYASEILSALKHVLYHNFIFRRHVRDKADHRGNAPPMIFF